MSLTEKDFELLQILKDRAAELGYMPLVAGVKEPSRIKAHFRCWKDAILAAGLPSEKAREQVARRIDARAKPQE